MLTILDADTTEGARALSQLAASRSSIDFDTLIETIPIVRAVLTAAEPGVALLEAVTRFDGVLLTPDALVVNPQTQDVSSPGKEFEAAFRLAEARIRAYHERQRLAGESFSDELGVCFQETAVPHAAAGVYVPGGRAFYPSSLLMGVIPAQVAGVKKIVVATPPRSFSQSAELRWATRALGIETVLLAGGAHGIAALVRLFGCTKIVGPGNRFVAAAKHLVSGLVSVDLPAGPSEVLILATEGASPEFVAADLLAQAEHDPDAICVAFVSSDALAGAIRGELEKQLELLPTRETARRSLVSHGKLFVIRETEKMKEHAQQFAPEHLQLMGEEAERMAPELVAFAGAVFSGANTPTAFGDYLAGPNHVLPTGGAARSFSGLSTRDFYRWGRSVTVSAQALPHLAPAAAALAKFEGLFGHARSVERRLPQ